MILDQRLLRNRVSAMPIAPSIVPARAPVVPVPGAGSQPLELPALPGHPGTPRAEDVEEPGNGPPGEPVPMRAWGAVDRGSVLIVSASKLGSAIERALVRAGVATRRLTAAGEALRNMRPSTRAVVLAPPLEILSPETAVHVLDEPARRADAPMVVVLDEHEPVLEERRADLIESGAEQVYSWPRDGLRLALSLAALR